MSGSWDIAYAVLQQWEAHGLDAKFQAYWAAVHKSRFPALQENTVEAGTPMPFCTFEINENKNAERMSGAYNTEYGRVLKTQKNAIWEGEVEFRLHDRTKERLVSLVKLVTAAFDSQGFAGLDSCILQMIRETDMCMREAEDDWVWTLVYKVIQDTQVTIS